MAAKEPVVEPEVASPSSTVDNGEEQESPVQQSNNDAEVQLDSQMMTLFPNWVKVMLITRLHLFRFRTYMYLLRRLHRVSSQNRRNHNNRETIPKELLRCRILHQPPQLLNHLWVHQRRLLILVYTPSCRPDLHPAPIHTLMAHHRWEFRNLHNLKHLRHLSQVAIQNRKICRI